MTNIERALEYWRRVLETWPTDNKTVHGWIESVRNDRGDYYRNLGSIAMIAIGEHCRIGRIGYDDEKEESAKRQLVAWAEELNLGGQW